MMHMVMIQITCGHGESRLSIASKLVASLIPRSYSYCYAQAREGKQGSGN